jgi:kynureninase
MVLIGPDEGQYEIQTEKILSIIDQHAEDAALLLLPGIQYYTGQLFDIPTITKYAQSKGLIVGWDLAHAYANVDLKLHDWNVDFAAWCTYKYGNAGPGAMGGLFVHERHGQVDYSAGPDTPKFRHRLTGWYGGDRSVRFMMDNSEFMLSLIFFPFSAFPSHLILHIESRTCTNSHQSSSPFLERVDSSFPTPPS